jgi:hypothetical protein
VGTNNINSIAFFVPKNYVPKYQVEHKINILIEDIMNLMQSIYFRNDNKLKVITDSSKAGITGMISLRECEDLNEHDYLVRSYIFTEIKSKLQNKYKEAVFEYNL